MFLKYSYLSMSKALLYCIFLIFHVKSAICQETVSCNPKCSTGYKCMLGNCVLNVTCPPANKYGSGPPDKCPAPSDPLNKPPSKLESWFTKAIFDDLFPKSNIGWGPQGCFPYNYESFAIASRYFPLFGTESPSNNGYTPEVNFKRDIAAFFAHSIQETGENDISLYDVLPEDQADACFYRGGFYNWFEGGPTSSFLPPETPGYNPQDGSQCTSSGRYCETSPALNFAYPCSQAQNGSYYLGCYFGRGSIQISYNYNYGMFQRWLQEQGLNLNILDNPNLVMTSTNPPLAIMASLWFYMTPQPPKPAMHDIILGNWEPGSKNRAVNYTGPILGPTSLIINDECTGEDPTNPGGPGENRRIKAFKWFCSYFNVPPGSEFTLTCENMVQKFDEMQSFLNVSWQPDWQTSWKNQVCNCAPASYGGLLPYYQPNFYPEQFVQKNTHYQGICVKLMYNQPQLFDLNANTSSCLLYKPTPNYP